MFVVLCVACAMFDKYAVLFSSVKTNTKARDLAVFFFNERLGTRPHNKQGLDFLALIIMSQLCFSGDMFDDFVVSSSVSWCYV